MQKTWVQSLGQEDPLEEEIAITPVFLPGKSHGQKRLAGYSPWGRKELDTTEATSHTCTDKNTEAQDCNLPYITQVVSEELELETSWFNSKAHVV